MILDLISLVVGLGLLVYAADNFVLGSARLATLLDMSPVVIGAVVMGFGTSAPEMLVSAIAAGGGDRDLGVGNIVGSNVANLTLVLGTAAFVTRMTISRTTVRREIPLAIGASIVFAVFVGTWMPLPDVPDMMSFAAILAVGQEVVIGMALGGSVLAAFTDFLYQDDALLHYSIATANGIFYPIAAILFWYCMAAYRKALTESAQ